MTRKSKKMRRRSVSPRRRSCSRRLPGDSLPENKNVYGAIANAVPKELSSLIFVGKISRCSKSTGDLGYVKT